ncbi:MAG: 16S rRNA (adenine(1518)-N(6)/adenine(1519)-N(6))-dimethyltransferase RsmA [Spirulina sp.]
MVFQPTRKRFGQHWLRSDKVLRNIVVAAAVTPQDCVLEIGPGTGILTQSLLPQAQAVVAVEIDRDLCRQLTQTFAKTPNFRLVQGDFLGVEPSALAFPAPHDNPAEPWRSWPNKVVANIPYYITGPILEKLLGTIANPNPHPYDSIILLVQKEVAERLYAKPGNRSFGALSVRVQYLADCELVCPVPAKAFQPPPKVDSAVVKLTPRPLSVVANQPDALDRLVRLGFASKRKMLRNNLKSTVDRDHLLATMTDLAIPETSRAEDLSVDQWVALSNRLGQGLAQD